MAAEAILSGSINSQRSSVTQHSMTRTPDIVFSEDLIAGARHNGRMSNVRRFFCLFVTFDLLLTFLMWLICTMVCCIVSSLETSKCLINIDRNIDLVGNVIFWCNACDLLAAIYYMEKLLFLLYIFILTSAKDVLLYLFIS